MMDAPTGKLGGCVHPLVPQGLGSHATVFEFGSLGGLALLWGRGSLGWCKRTSGDLLRWGTTTTFIYAALPPPDNGSRSWTSFTKETNFHILRKRLDVILMYSNPSSEITIYTSQALVHPNLFIYNLRASYFTAWILIAIDGYNGQNSLWGNVKQRTTNSGLKDEGVAHHFWKWHFLLSH